MIDVQITRGIAIVSMKPYKPRVVEALRSIRGRRWDAKSKTWAIPVSTLQQSVEKLVRTGEMVMVNGKEWQGNADTRQAIATEKAAQVEAELASNPFAPLWTALPARLRQPVYEALFAVLAPGAGGDVELVVLLDEANQAHTSQVVQAS
jgi:hypothetical protein